MIPVRTGIYNGYAHRALEGDRERGQRAALQWEELVLGYMHDPESRPSAQPVPGVSDEEDH